MTLQTALNWQKLYQITPTLKNCFPKVQITIGYNKIKIHRILLVCEKFVRSAFFELILAFYPRDLMRGSNTPRISREPELLWMLEQLIDSHEM